VAGTLSEQARGLAGRYVARSRTRAVLAGNGGAPAPITFVLLLDENGTFGMHDSVAGTVEPGDLWSYGTWRPERAEDGSLRVRIQQRIVAEPKLPGLPWLEYSWKVSGTTLESSEDRTWTRE